MTAVKVRSGGAWVDSQITEKVRIGGAWVEFSPGGVTYEVITWVPSTPADTDENDGDQGYNMGASFTTTAAVQCTGVQWRVPDTVATPWGTHAVGLWTAGGTRLALKTFTAVTGGYQDILFDSAQSLSAATTYVATVYTNHYVFTTGGTVAGALSPSGNLTGVTGRLVADNSGAASAGFPSSTTSLNFYVSPICEVP